VGCLVGDAVGRLVGFALGNGDVKPHVLSLARTLSSYLGSKRERKPALVLSEVI